MLRSDSQMGELGTSDGGYPSVPSGYGRADAAKQSP
jgi:hypothetical protein